MFFFSSSKSENTSADQCTRNRSSSVWCRAITSSPFLSSQWSRSVGSPVNTVSNASPAGIC